METLKLEVGKSYINREGKEVKIIKKDDQNTYPCQGDNGEWYAESGRFAYTTETPYDLIEEIEAPPATRHTFAIPDGVKEITLDYFGNRIVVEMVPGKEPKAGDVMVNDIGSVYIFKSVEDDECHNHFAWLGVNGRLSIENICDPGRHATPEEAQPLFDALKKAGKRWNPETMEVEEVSEIDRIREWMDMNIKCGGEVVDIAEVIEAYLKHKEEK